MVGGRFEDSLGSISVGHRWWDGCCCCRYRLLELVTKQDQFRDRGSVCGCCCVEVHAGTAAWNER